MKYINKCICNSYCFQIESKKYKLCCSSIDLPFFSDFDIKVKRNELGMYLGNITFSIVNKVLKSIKFSFDSNEFVIDNSTKFEVIVVKDIEFTSNLPYNYVFQYSNVLYLKISNTNIVNIIDLSSDIAKLADAATRGYDEYKKILNNSLQKSLLEEICSYEDIVFMNKL